jgi:hypothetical protein
MPVSVPRCFFGRILPVLKMLKRIRCGLAELGFCVTEEQIINIQGTGSGRGGNKFRQVQHILRLCFVIMREKVPHMLWLGLGLRN